MKMLKYNEIINLRDIAEDIVLATIQITDEAKANDSIKSFLQKVEKDYYINFIDWKDSFNKHITNKDLGFIEVNQKIKGRVVIIQEVAPHHEFL